MVEKPFQLRDLVAAVRMTPTIVAVQGACSFAERFPFEA
jgi:hypothetical protein